MSFVGIGKGRRSLALVHAVLLSEEQQVKSDEDCDVEVYWFVCWNARCDGWFRRGMHACLHFGPFSCLERKQAAPTNINTKL